MSRGAHANHARGGRCSRWTDQKIISVDGYVKLRVGKGHPLADPNGYAYEHKVVLAAAGVAVPVGHVIHHLSGDKTDNRIENLKVIARAAHSQEHSAAGLTDDDVRAIRAAYAEGRLDTMELAAKYGTPHQRVWKIVKGMTRRGAGGPVCAGSLRGKRAAGRLLDGVEHLAAPEVGR